LYHGTYVVQTRPNAEHFLYIEGEKTASGMRFVSRFRTPDGTCRPEDTAPLQAIEDGVQRWLDKPVGKLRIPLPVGDRVNMALHGSALADFFNQVQLAATGAQLSCAGVANHLPGFNSEAHMRDIAANCPFNDLLLVLEVTAEVLRLAFERCASYLEINEYGRPEIASRFLLPKVEHYNYDFFAGVTYTADLRKPVGSRVSDILYRGRVLPPHEKLTLCLSAYRASGTGGYEAYRDCPVVYRGHETMGDLVRQYIIDHEEAEIIKYAAPEFLY
jgi:2',3'-cyclic-nucleotide 2'-phosphodiesterase/3'-nucleotidase